MLYILGLICSTLIGFSLGLIGGGGSIITVPVLVYLLGVPVHQAIGMSLAVVGSTSLAGVYLHYRHGGNIDLKAGLFFGASGLIGAYPGSFLTHLVHEQTLMICFSLLMILVAAAMLFRRNLQADRPPAAAWKNMAAGIVVGLITGFLGVGGGFLIVPALVLFSGLNTKTAIGTSLFVITMNCAAALIGHLQVASLNFQGTVLVSALALSGLTAGILLSRHTSPAYLHRLFAVFVFGVGSVLFLLNFLF